MKASKHSEEKDVKESSDIEEEKTDEKNKTAVQKAVLNEKDAKSETKETTKNE